MLGVVPANEPVYPPPCFLQRGKATGGPLRPVLQYPEQRFNEGIIVADPGTAVRGQHAQFFQLGLHGLRLHRRTVIRVQHQRLVQTLFTQLATLQELGGILATLGLMDFITDDLRSEEHTSELQSRPHLVCRLLLEKKKTISTHSEWLRSHLP